MATQHSPKSRFREILAKATLTPPSPNPASPGLSRKRANPEDQDKEAESRKRAYTEGSHKDTEHIPQAKMSKDGEPSLKEIMDEIKKSHWKMEENHKETKTHMQLLSDRISNIESRVVTLEATDESQGQEIVRLKSELSNANSAIEIQKKTLAVLSDEVRKGNILIMGIPETEKSENERRSLAESIIHKITGIHIKVDTLYRKGEFSQDKNRPIVVTLFSHSDRNRVLAAAKQNVPTGSRPVIKADLCLETRLALHKKWEEKTGNGTGTGPHGASQMQQQSQSQGGPHLHNGRITSAAAPNNTQFRKY